MKEILSESPFEDPSPDWRPYASLRDLDPELPQEGWEYSGRQICNNFLSLLEDLYVKNGEKDGLLNQTDVDFLIKIRSDIKEYKIFKKDQEKIFVQRNFPKREANLSDTNFWPLIHKDITTHAKKRFDDGYYAG